MSILENKIVNGGLATLSLDSDDGKKNIESTINLDMGSPDVYEEYWKRLGDFNITIPCNRSLSYVVNPNNVCWYLMPKLEEEIKSIHKIVGNAVIEDRHIVVGTGSTQLIQAAFYALSNIFNQSNPISVMAAAPYYSVSYL
ncbi:hypothetical protein ACS0TY_009053 [Phlomoides rotata]